MYDPDRHHRRSARLRDIAYTEAGLYYVTVCTLGRVCLFGEVVAGAVRLNDLGQIVQDEWERTAIVRSYVALDAFVVMPNHVHGIIGIITEPGRADSFRPSPRFDGRDTVGGRDDAVGGMGTDCRGERPLAPTRRSFEGTAPASLGAIVGNVKATVTKRINAVWGTPGEKVWQRGYYDHVIRNGRDLERIRRYIVENPRRWDSDRYNEG